MLIERNKFADGHWVIEKITDRGVCSSFDCGIADLNEYFHKDAIKYKKLLLTESYYLHIDDKPGIALALLDFCNDSINLDKYKLKGKIVVPKGKPQRYWPAVKLTRLGVAAELQGQNIGSNILNMVKKVFITDNRTGCRFLTVDARKDDRVINFYQKNGFELLPDDRDDTQLMYFDLKRHLSLN